MSDTHTPAQPTVKAEKLTRYCPGCGSVGAVNIRYLNCCPDGNDARMIPERLANQCRDTFKLAVGAIAPPPVITPEWVMLTDSDIDKSARSSGVDDRLHRMRQFAKVIQAAFIAKQNGIL